MTNKNKKNKKVCNKYSKNKKNSKNKNVKMLNKIIFYKINLRNHKSQKLLAKCSGEMDYKCNQSILFTLISKKAINYKNRSRSEMIFNL